jgi:hypothetical protein
MKTVPMTRAAGESAQAHIARLLALDLTGLTAEEQAELVLQLCAAERQCRQAREQLLPMEKGESEGGPAKACG